MIHMREIINTVSRLEMLVESDSVGGYLYHGTSRSKLPSILAEGIDPPSYWGEYEKARTFAEEYSDGVIIAISVSHLNEELLAPNENFVEYFEDNDPENENYQDWLNSEQTWRDSLAIFDSVVYHGVVHVTEQDIVD